MKPLHQILPSNIGGNPFLGLLICAMAIVGAYEAANFILAGDTVGLVYVALAFVVGAFVIAMLNDFRRGLYIFLVWLLFEDFFRKYLGNDMLIFFAKDFLVAVVYLSFFLAWRRKQIQSFKPPFLMPLLLLVWFGFLQVFNPASPHILYGILGMKLFFYYIPLLLVGYSLVNSELELRAFLKINLIPILVIVALGIAQSIIGPTFLNPATIQEDIRELSSLYRVAPISGVIVYRPTSVFVSTGRYSDLLVVAWLLSLGFLGYTLLRFHKGRSLAFLSVALVVAGMLLSASRGVFAWGLINIVVVAAAFLWGAPWRQREVMRVLRAFFRAGLGVALAVTMLLVIFPEALLDRLAVYSETLSPTSSASELTHRARDYPLQNFVGAFGYDRWPYGYGIGTTALGIQYITRIFGVKPLGIGVESGFGGLVVEMGIGGLVLWLIMGIAVVTSAWKIVRELRGSPWFPIGFVVFWYAFLMLFPFMVGGIQSYEDFVLNAYLWLLLGILFRLPHIKVSAELDAARLAAQMPRRRWIL
ncbi:MAG TPA: hypothetical protein VKP58_07940 [Candidatus Acidoferrum sp.]|nr:hypothetical protein [Candidatus Acidoferrum sp.]